MDAFSRYVHLIPIYDTSSASAIEGLRWYLWQNPTPIRIHTDAGSQFTSVSWREYLTTRNIESTNGIPYAHRTNGLVERVNAEIRRHTSAVTIETGATIWDCYLKIQDILNEHRNATTGCSPNQLMLGSFVHAPKPLVNERGMAMTLREYRRLMERDHAPMLELARANQIKEIDRRCKQYKKDHAVSHDYDENAMYREGDYVLAEFADHMLPGKGGPACDGPLEIVEILGFNACSCSHLTTSVVRTYSFHQLVPYFMNDYEPRPYYVAARSRAAWVIEKVVAHRYRGGELFVLVKWENFTNEANSWESCKDNKNNSVILLYCAEKKLPFGRPRPLQPYRPHRAKGKSFRVRD
jgi:hypothetical protein